MKKITSSILAALAVSTFAFAGGEIQPVEPMVETSPSILDGFYVGIGASKMKSTFILGTYDGSVIESQMKQESNPMAYTAVVGYDYNKYIGVEARYSKFSKYDIDISFLDYDGWHVSATENDYTANFSNLALYLKPQYGITDSISIYGLVGYGQTKFAPTYLMDVKTSCNTFQYGIGTKYSFANGVSFFVDYTVMANDKEIHRIQDIASLTRYDKLSMDLSATTFGVSYSF